MKILTSVWPDYKAKGIKNYIIAGITIIGFVILAMGVLYVIGYVHNNISTLLAYFLIVGVLIIVIYGVYLFLEPWFREYLGMLETPNE